MAKHLHAVRVFFSTYYDDVAAEIIDKIRERYGEGLRVKRSRVVPELYHLEVAVSNPDSLEKTAREIEEILAESTHDGKVYGAKVYTVPPLKGVGAEGRGVSAG